MNWRTIFLTTTLVFIFFSSNNAVADTGDSIAECNDFRTECLEKAANSDLVWEIFIDIVYKEMLKACDALYKNCIKAANKARGRIPRGSGWLVCQTARLGCKGAAWVLKTGAHLVRNINTGRRVTLCNDAYKECLLGAVNPFD